MAEEFIGKLIDRKYRLLSVLGRGGMGVVYRAEQLDADGRPLRHVALKTLLPKYFANPNVAKRFSREVRVAMQLRSLHTVMVYDSGRDYYTMELINGLTLEQVLERQGPLSVARAITLAGQICEALAEAHGLPEPVVHRDLKPSNIFIEQRQGRELAKIGDFGIAKIVSEQATNLTQVGYSSPGTPTYMAPEQWKGEAVDGRTDLYALGVILYKMLTGRLPFDGEGDWETLRDQHLGMSPPLLPATVPAGVRAQVERLLAKAPQQRPADALSVRRALEAAWDQEEERPTVILPQDDTVTAKPKPLPPVPAPPPVPRRSWRRALLAVTVGVSLVVLAALSLWAYSQWQQGEAEQQRQAQLQQQEAARQAEAQRQAAEVAKRQAEAETARLRAEAEETRRQAEAADARRKAEEEAKRKAEAEEERRQAEAAEAKRRAEEEAKKQMVTIPAGDFFMGCDEAVDKQCDDDEKPGRKVYLDAFSIDKYEVTVADYRWCVEAGRCSLDGLTLYDSCNWNKSGRTNHPINCVDWNQAQQYCQWAGKRLPSEAEWEKAARGPDGLVYPWGNQWDGSKANVGSSGTVPVGSYPPGRSYAVYDMAGNVWEWVQDWYANDYYKRGSERNPRGPERGEDRSVRGGSWYPDPGVARAAYRYRHPLGSRLDVVGFRCAQ